MYNIGLKLYLLAAGAAGVFSEKASRFHRGRRFLNKRIYGAMCRYTESKGRRYWFHCASAGEFEQARPLIDEIKKREQDSVVVVTFFSPSGYELRKNYNNADEVFYLPMDTSGNARRFIDSVKPDVVFFIKYEFWKNYLGVLNKRGIPVYLVSAIFRSNQRFFGLGGAFMRKVLGRFTHMFVQDSNSADLLASAGFENVTVAGDTRFDRVWEVMQGSEKVDELELLKGSPGQVNTLYCVAGSTWPADEELICSFLTLAGRQDNGFVNKVRLVIAPHEVSGKRVKDILKMFGSFNTAVYTELRDADVRVKEEILASCDVLVVDVMGILSRLYAYADIAYVGGGFGVGIHNTLEAAVYGVPVVFGPEFGKFREAVALTDMGGAFATDMSGRVVKGNYNGPESNILLALVKDKELRDNSSQVCRRYVSDNKGATANILKSAAPGSTNK